MQLYLAKILRNFKAKVNHTQANFIAIGHLNFPYLYYFY